MPADKPKIKFMGQPGQKQLVMARCNTAMEAASWERERRLEMLTKMAAADYVDFLMLVMENFDIS